MTASSSAPPSQDEHLAEQAAQWCVRLQDEACTAEDRAAWRAWLEADPRHAREFAAVSALWEDARALPLAAAAPRRAARAKQAWRHGLALCASIAALWVAGWAASLLPSSHQSYRSAANTQEITLADGSSVTLNLDTSLTFQEYRTRRRVQLTEGEAYFRVVSDTTRPFVVEAGKGTITVTGTVFNVWKSGETVIVTLEEGGVTVQADATDDRHAVRLRPLMQARYGSRGAPSVRPVQEAEIAAWRDGKLVFDGVTLADAVMQFNRYLPATERYARIDPAVANLKLGGSYDTRNVADLAQVLPRILPVRVQRGAGGLALLPVGPSAR